MLLPPVKRLGWMLCCAVLQSGSVGGREGADLLLVSRAACQGAHREAWGLSRGWLRTWHAQNQSAAVHFQHVWRLCCPPAPPQDIANPRQLDELSPRELSFWVGSLFAGSPYQQQVGRLAGRSGRRGVWAHRLRWLRSPTVGIPGTAVLPLSLAVPTTHPLSTPPELQALLEEETTVGRLKAEKVRSPCCLLRAACCLPLAACCYPVLSLMDAATNGWRPSICKRTPPAGCSCAAPTSRRTSQTAAYLSNPPAGADERHRQVSVGPGGAAERLQNDWRQQRRRPHAAARRPRLSRRATAIAWVACCGRRLPFDARPLMPAASHSMLCVPKPALAVPTGGTCQLRISAPLFHSVTSSQCACGPQMYLPQFSLICPSIGLPDCSESVNCFTGMAPRGHDRA